MKANTILKRIIGEKTYIRPCIDLKTGEATYTILRMSDIDKLHPDVRKIIIEDNENGFYETFIKTHGARLVC